MHPRAKAKLTMFWRHWVRPIVVVVVATSAFRSAIADWNVVPTGSMKPSIVAGDRILVNKLAYGLRVPFTDWQLLQWSQPQRGEVVVFFAPDGGPRMVKRVIGVPGDTIQLYGNRLIINGALTQYSLVDGQLAEKVEGELERRGCRLRQRGRSGWQSGFCPFHDNTKTAAFSVNLSKGWICFSTCGTGSIFGLARKLGVEISTSRPKRRTTSIGSHKEPISVTSWEVRG